jgi:G:T/U-mismatch repair DNA glycosylase
MRTLPDYLRKGMKMILVGANPGERSARVGHYYAGRGNQFWPILYGSGVIPEPIGSKRSSGRNSPRGVCYWRRSSKICGLA